MARFRFLPWCVAAALCAGVNPLFAQYGPDSFEAYEAGSFIVGQGNWRSWNDVPGGPGGIDAVVAEGTAQSGSRSLRIDPNTDIVQLFDGQFMAGLWTVTAWLRIPSATTTGTLTFALLNNYQSGAGGDKNWSTQIRFHPTTTRVESAGGSGFNMPGQLPYAPDAWNRLQIVVDLDQLTQQVFFNNSPLAEGPWHAGGATTQDALACLNISSNGAADALVDDVTVEFGFDCRDCCPPDALACTANASAQTVELSWSSQGSHYSGGITIARNGVDIVTLAGDAEGYFDSNPVPGINTYTVAGNCDGALDASASCSVCLETIPAEISDFVWSAGSGGSPESAASIAAELTAAGQRPLVCTTLHLPEPTTSPLMGLWICLGVFPNNHQLTFEEGQAIVDWAGAREDRYFYVEGGDAWGFDPPTPLADIDGTSATSFGSSSCDVPGIHGLDSGVPDGLDLSGFDAAYQSDCLWIDHLVPDDITAAGAVFINTGGAENMTGIYHDARRDDTGFHRNVCASTLFGGFAGNRSGLMENYLDTFLPASAFIKFIRGDATGDGSFHALADALRLMNFAFSPGFPAPPCMAAADADANFTVNGLVDSLQILNFGFLPGSPPIPPPFPDCGTDPPSVRALGCLQTACP